MDAPEAASLTWGPGPFSTLGAAVSHQPVGQEQGVVAVGCTESSLSPIRTYPLIWETL